MPDNPTRRARRRPRQAPGRPRNPAVVHFERQAYLRQLLDLVRRDYLQAAEAGYLPARTGEGSGRSTDVSDPTGNLGAADRRLGGLRADAARALRTADRHLEDAIASAEKARKALSRPFVRAGDWSSMKDSGGGRTATKAEVAEAQARAAARLARGEE